MDLHFTLTEKQRIDCNKYSGSCQYCRKAAIYIYEKYYSVTVTYCKLKIKNILYYTTTIYFQPYRKYFFCKSHLFKVDLFCSFSLIQFYSFQSSFGFDSQLHLILSFSSSLFKARLQLSSDWLSCVYKWFKQQVGGAYASRGEENTQYIHIQDIIFHWHDTEPQI